MSKNSVLPGEVRYGNIVARSAVMLKVFDLIDSVSLTDSTVLITGESGTGKELVARAIAMSAERSMKPFVAVNCGALAPNLMESELFGHEKGVVTSKPGKFEYADGGTIFLDEISTLGPNLQTKLLRVFQDMTFERVGSNTPIKVNVRVIAATNVDLGREVEEGRFRGDLYYRLKVVPIDLPTLRERKEDIELLVRHFIETHSSKCNKVVRGISPDALAALVEYSWPGNIRELRNLVESLVVLAKDGSTITYGDLPAGLVGASCTPGDEHSGLTYKEAVTVFEKEYILGVLKSTKWNRTRAAELMDVHRNTLYHKIKNLGLKRPAR
ncbi:MAG: sigma-54-dependent Fis family transcriptional regulator [Proteobacteria bacterium]|nr:sigma-54-dependent Fis family transcriptional regulator [Pseudomonadota bacterium]